MDETEDFHLTIYTAGPIEALAEILAGIIGATSVTPITGYWNSGIGVHSATGAKVDGIGDPQQIMEALDATQEWLNGSGEPGLVLEIYPTYYRSMIGL